MHLALHTEPRARLRGRWLGVDNRIGLMLSHRLNKRATWPSVVSTVKWQRVWATIPLLGLERPAT